MLITPVGELETMKLMHDMGCPINEHVSYAAAQYAGVASDQQEKRAVLEWLAEVGAPMEKAASLNSYNDPKWAGLQVEAFRFAASKGGALNAAATTRLLLETDPRHGRVRWIRKQGCDLSGVDASSAGALWNFHAYEGGLQEIERLYASKLPWHEWALPAAIDSLDDELSVVKWMVEKGCPVSGRCTLRAPLEASECCPSSSFSTPKVPAGRPGPPSSSTRRPMTIPATSIACGPSPTAATRQSIRAASRPLSG